MRKLPILIIANLLLCVPHIQVFAAMDCKSTALRDCDAIIPTPTIPADQTQLFVRQALMDSILREKIPFAAKVLPASLPPAPPAGAVSSPVIVPTGHIIHPDTPVPTAPVVEVPKAARAVQSPKGGQKVLASLSSLTRRLSEPRQHVSSERGTTGQSLSGFEGIGDLPVASPYSILLGTESRNPLRQTAASPREHSKVVGPRFRSLSMLQQRLDASDQAQQKSNSGAE